MMPGGHVAWGDVASSTLDAAHEGLTQVVAGSGGKIIIIGTRGGGRGMSVVSGIWQHTIIIIILIMLHVGARGWPRHARRLHEHGAPSTFLSHLSQRINQLLLY